MGVWNPDPVLPPLKCILISYQLSCEGSKLSALTEFPWEFGDCCKNPSSNLLTVTLISGRIGCLVRKSQAEQPDNSWLSGPGSKHFASKQKTTRNLCFPAQRVMIFWPWLYIQAGRKITCGRFRMSLPSSGIKGNLHLGKRTGCSVAFLCP